MSKGRQETVYYFSEKGPANTEKALDIAINATRERGIAKIVVASSTGATALKLNSMAKGSVEIIAVTYGAGSRFQSEVEEFNKNRKNLEGCGKEFCEQVQKRLYTTEYCR